MLRPEAFKIVSLPGLVCQDMHYEGACNHSSMTNQLQSITTHVQHCNILWQVRTGIDDGPITACAAFNWKGCRAADLAQLFRSILLHLQVMGRPALSLLYIAATRFVVDGMIERNIVHLAVHRPSNCSYMAVAVACVAAGSMRHPSWL